MMLAHLVAVVAGVLVLAAVPGNVSGPCEGTCTSGKTGWDESASFEASFLFSQ